MPTGLTISSNGSEANTMVSDRFPGPHAESLNSLDDILRLCPLSMRECRQEIAGRSYREVDRFMQPDDSYSDQPRVVTASRHEDCCHHRPSPPAGAIQGFRPSGIIPALWANQAGSAGHVVPALRAARPSTAAVLEEPQIEQRDREAGSHSDGCPDDQDGRSHEQHYAARQRVFTMRGASEMIRGR